MAIACHGELHALLKFYVFVHRLLKVGAATPVIAGVFAILRGFHGREEQAISRAMHILRGGNPGDFAAGLADSEEWQAHREAAMAGLVRRALSGYGMADGVGAVAGNVFSRRLQVGCTEGPLLRQIDVEKSDGTGLARSLFQILELKDRGVASPPIQPKIRTRMLSL